MLYFNLSNNLQQSIFNDGRWFDSAVYPASQPPSSSSRLCSSTNFYPNNTSELVQPGLSLGIQSPVVSVAIYETTNQSLVMIDTLSLDNFIGDPHTNLNLLQLGSTSYYSDLFAGLSFACVFNAPNPTQLSQYFTRIVYQGALESTEGSPSAAVLRDNYYLYNDTALRNNSFINKFAGGG